METGPSEVHGLDWRIGSDGKVYNKSRKIYPNNDTYDGEFVGNKKQGYGKLITNDGSNYTGYFENDMFHGKGKKIWGSFINKLGENVKNKTYEGEWNKNHFDGKGILSYGDNQGNYIGYFKNGIYDGEGILVKPNGTIIKGLFCKGEPYGSMNVTFLNGDIYEGGMKGDKFHGTGKLMYGKRQGQGSYEGTFKNGQKHGQGVRIFTNGNKYMGKFVENEICGEGIMHYVCGNVYSGGWKGGFYDGKGSLLYSHGERYEGDFVKGHMHGEGTYHYTDGGQYTGDFKSTVLYKGLPRPVFDSKRCGYGVRTWTSGSVYEGRWRDNAMNGEGVLTNVLGGRFVGTWVNGRRSGQGMEEFGNRLGMVYVCPLGHRHSGDGYCVYTGDFVENEFSGRGEFRCIDGRSYSGQWLRGARDGEGVQVFLKNNGIGDAERLYIGLGGSLYRVRSHVGLFKNNCRQGYGISIYTNGDQLLGEFIHGMPHGIVVYKFRSGRSRLAMFDRGSRVRWIDSTSIDEAALSSFKIDMSHIKI